MPSSCCSRCRAQLQAAWPQLRGLADMPGALEMRAELLAALSRRFFARTIKMILGPQVSLPVPWTPIERHLARGALWLWSVYFQPLDASLDIATKPADRMLPG